jgi:hypothetical protein
MPIINKIQKIDKNNQDNKLYLFNKNKETP